MTALGAAPQGRPRVALSKGIASRGVLSLLLSLLPLLFVAARPQTTAKRAVEGGCSLTNKCQHMGTCQLNSGVCSCPLGYSGTLCEELLWPACRVSKDSTAEGHPAAMYCENWMCARGGARVWLQERRHPPLDFHLFNSLIVFAKSSWYEEHPCFTWDGAPLEDQLSTYPPAGTPIAYYESFRAFRSSGGGSKTSAEIYYEHKWKASHVDLAPIGDCPAQCSGEGNCLRHGQGGQPQCGCFFGRDGLTCERTMTLACYSECSGRGTCVRGYCSCESGLFGLDCSIELSKIAHFHDRTVFPRPEEFPWDQAQREWLPEPLPGDEPAVPDQKPYEGPYSDEEKARRARPDKLRIYMYELPNWINLAAETDAQRVAGNYRQRDRGIYCSYNLFTEQFLTDFSVRTLDPYEANLFYVPILPYGATENGREGAYLAMRTVELLRKLWPFWDRFGGTDHIFIAGYKGAQIPKLVRDSIWLSHWGAGFASKAAVAGVPQWHPQPCFETSHHIVIPPGLHKIHLTAAETYREDAPGPAGEGVGSRRPRDTLLMFAGNVDFNWLTYSQGVRQRAFVAYGHKPGFDINDGYVNRALGHRAYDESMRSSLFCLAVAGGGWGQRLISALVSGCIPVVVMDAVRQPGDDVLPFEEFSIRVTQDDLDDLEGILRAIPVERVRELQAGVRKWYRYFYWLGDGLAYNLTLMSLQKKAWNVLALYPGR